MHLSLSIFLDGLPHSLGLVTNVPRLTFLHAFMTCLILLIEVHHMALGTCVKKCSRLRETRRAGEKNRFVRAPLEFFSSQNILTGLRSD